MVRLRGRVETILWAYCQYYTEETWVAALTIRKASLAASKRERPSHACEEQLGGRVTARRIQPQELYPIFMRTFTLALAHLLVETERA